VRVFSQKRNIRLLQVSNVNTIIRSREQHIRAKTHLWCPAPAIVHWNGWSAWDLVWAKESWFIWLLCSYGREGALHETSYESTNYFLTIVFLTRKWLLWRIYQNNGKKFIAALLFWFKTL